MYGFASSIMIRYIYQYNIGKLVSFLFHLKLLKLFSLQTVVCVCFFNTLKFNKNSFFIKYETKKIIHTHIDECLIDTLSYYKQNYTSISNRKPNISTNVVSDLNSIFSSQWALLPYRLSTRSPCFFLFSKNIHSRI